MIVEKPRTSPGLEVLALTIQSSPSTTGEEAGAAAAGVAGVRSLPGNALLIIGGRLRGGFGLGMADHATARL
jgi:hypothetical protein